MSGPAICGCSRPADAAQRRTDDPGEDRIPYQRGKFAEERQHALDAWGNPVSAQDADRLASENVPHLAADKREVHDYVWHVSGVVHAQQPLAGTSRVEAYSLDPRWPFACAPY